MAVQGENSLFFSTGLDNSGLLKGKEEGVGIIQSMATDISKINPFAALAIGAAAAFTLIANDAYRLASEFEHAMKEVETISVATQANFKGISEDVFSLSKISPDEPKELANAYYQIVSAGYDGAKGLELLEVASKAAVAGVTDTITAADGLTTVLNAYKIEAEKSEEVSDALFNTVKLGKTTFTELAAYISQVAPIAAASNIPLNEILSTVATLTKQGVPTAQAMTQIRAAIVGLSEAGKLDGTKTFQQNMSALFDEMNGSQTAIKKQVGSIEAVQAILAVSGKNARSAKADLKTYNNTLGATQRAADIMLNDHENQWKIFGNRIKASTIGIGNSVLKMSTSIARDLNSIIESVDDSIKSIEKEAVTVNSLFLKYNDANSSAEERIEIVKELKSISPSLVEGVNNEAEAYKVLSDNINQYNTLIAERKIIAEKEEDIAEHQKLYQDAIKGILEFKNKLNQDIVEFQIGDFQGNEYDPVRDQLQEVLSSQEDVIEKGKKVKEILTNYNSDIFRTKGIGGTISIPGFSNDAIEGNVNSFLKNTFEKAIERGKKERDKLKLSLYEMRTDIDNVVKEILSSSDENFIKLFKGSSNQLLVDASNKRTVILEEIEKTKKEIFQISSVDYAKDKSIFDKFLNKDKAISDLSEVQVAARKFAKERIELVERGEDPKTNLLDTDKLKESLAKKKEAYDSYEKLVHNGFETDAKKYKEGLNLQYSSYQEYLNKKLEAAKTTAEKLLYLEAGAGTRVKEGAIEGVVKGAVEIDSTQYVDYVKSVKTLNGELLQLEKELASSTNEIEREKLAIKVQFKKEELDQAKGVGEKLIKIEENNYDFLSLLGLKKLRDEKKIAEARLKTAKEKAKKEAAVSGGKASVATQNEIKQLENNVTGIAKSFGEELANQMSLVSSALGDAQSLFSKFGEEGVAELLGQLSGVADGVGRIASGDIVGGSLAVLNSALTVEVVSDTEKFEEAIKELEKISIQISNNIKNTVGVNQAKEKLNYINSIKEKEEKLKAAQEAESKARKAVKVFGIKVGKKGTGSGTDQAKLEQFQADADAAKQEIIELKEEYDAFITSTTRDTFADNIFEGLKDGESAIESFANAFEDIVGNAILETFKKEHLEPLSKEFLDKFAELYDTDASLALDQEEKVRAIKEEYESSVYEWENTPSRKTKQEVLVEKERIAELKRSLEREQKKLEALQAGVGVADFTDQDLAELRAWTEENAKKTEQYWEAIKKTTEDLGLDFGSSEQKGLTGSVRREITEETGSVLEGLFRGQNDYTKRLLALAEQEAVAYSVSNSYAKDSERHLSQIVINTANTVSRLDTLISKTETLIVNTTPSQSARDMGHI
ncbi:phage tail tape measure protein [Flavicella sediminum]|uniref:phage tail tape measure protein n=1 Tax=Flavicella sediminum TaxID=2585141 RepID=UPI001122FC75|nr:phage tail tape measure protein [Flavicella sediminum]